MTRDQIEEYSYAVNKHRMSFVPEEMLPKFHWGVKIRNEDVKNLLTPEEGEKMDKDLTFRLSKEIYKEFISPIDNSAVLKAQLKAQHDQLVKACQFEYKKIIYSNGVTTILWKDGTKTTVRPAEGEEPNPGAGIAYCFMKRALGNKNGHNKVLRKEVPAVLAAEKKRRVEKDHKRMEKDLKEYQKEKENGETENS